MLLIALFVILTCAHQIAAAHNETPVPESLLKPRNFNPHPYEVASFYDGGGGGGHSQQQHIQRRRQSPASPLRGPANGRFSQGPVQFPDNNNNNIATAAPANHNPYNRRTAIRTNNIQQSNDYDYVREFFFFFITIILCAHATPFLG